MPHVKPYPLGWVCEDAKLQVRSNVNLDLQLLPCSLMRLSRMYSLLKFAEMTWVVHTYMIGKSYSIMKENKYHIFKYGIEYIVRAHCIETDVSIMSIGKMKRLFNVSKYFVLIIVKQNDKDVSDSFLGCDPSHKQELVKIISNYDDLF